MNRFLAFWFAMLGMAVMLVGCDKPPTEEMDAAKVAIGGAVAAGAEQYAREGLKDLNDALTAAQDEVRRQEGKLFKDYDDAKAMIAKINYDANALKTEAGQKKEQAKQEAIAAYAAAQDAVAQAKALLAEAPTGKGTKADIDAMKADLAGIEGSVAEIATLISSEEYFAATDKGKAISAKAADVSAQVQAAIEKAPKGRKRSPGESPGESLGEMGSIYWNAWLEDGDASDMPTFEPIRAISPLSAASLVLDLSLLRYVASDVVAREAGDQIRRHVRTLVDRGKTRSPIKFRTILIVDPDFLTSNERIKSLQFDMHAISRWVSPEVGDYTLEEQSAAGGLGSVVFPIQAQERTGWTSIAVSIWLDDTPVDEVHLKVCVGDASLCQAPPVLTESSPLSLRGYDPNAANGALPDAAIHLLELAPSKHLMGVLHRRNWEMDEFVTWKLEKTSRELFDYLKDTVTPALNSNPTKEALEYRALELQELLFPDTAGARSAREAFLALVDEHFANHTKASDTETASLHFRYVPFEDAAPIIFPMGFLGATVEGRVEFLGFHFRFELPFEQPSFGQPYCIDKWKLAFPASEANDQELLDAWSVLAANSLWPRLRDRGFKTTEEFRTWLANRTDVAESTLLFVVSHHDRNQLWFRDSDRILPESFLRTFSNPSVAVLNGCGTSTVAATELIRRLNAHGISAVIATLTRVKGLMAGQFLGCLEEKGIPDGAISETLGDAYTRAIRCLADKKAVGGVRYGPSALSYTLIGNSTVRLCRPGEGL